MEFLKNGGEKTMFNIGNAVSHNCQGTSRGRCSRLAAWDSWA